MLADTSSDGSDSEDGCDSTEEEALESAPSVAEGREGGTAAPHPRVKSEMMCRIYTHTASGQTPAHANHRADGTSTGDKQNRSKPTTAIDKWLSRNTLAGA